VSDRFSNQLRACEPVTSGVVTCEIVDLPLMPGRYVLDLWLEDFTSQEERDMIVDAASFEVAPADLLGTGRLPPAGEGPVFYRARWHLAKELEASEDVVATASK